MEIQRYRVICLIVNSQLFNYKIVRIDIIIIYHFNTKNICDMHLSIRSSLIFKIGTSGIGVLHI